ncbi:MAG: hypothetical protein JWM31_3002 [Solirubrobacterales bacterium]|nr:hypothetical protein [Solirubrobacterales bacterium]
MDAKEQQLEHLRDAVDRKAEAAKQASEKPPEEAADPTAGIDGDQASLWATGRTQDALDPRAKNSRHGKVTADKWNQ